MSSGLKKLVNFFKIVLVFFKFARAVPLHWFCIHASVDPQSLSEEQPGNMIFFFQKITVIRKIKLHFFIYVKILAILLIFLFSKLSFTYSSNEKNTFSMWYVKNHIHLIKVFFCFQKMN